MLTKKSVKGLSITRRQVLRAIKVEPLKPGAWVHFKRRGAGSRKPCKVCAVGAVLRQIGFDDDRVSYLGDDLHQFGQVATQYISDDTLKDLIMKGQYLRALSLKFEYLCHDRPRNQVRRELSEWVKENLPVKFNAEIGE